MLGMWLLGLPTLGFGGLLELHDLAFEVADVRETLVDGGEAQVRHRVERAEMVEHGEAEELAPHLGSLAPGPFLDVVGDDPGRVWRHRPAGDRELDPGLALGPLERPELTR